MVGFKVFAKLLDRGTFKDPEKAHEELAVSAGRKVKAVGELATPMKRASIYLDRWVQQNFKTEGGNVGGWQPFAFGGRLIPGGGLDTSAKLLQDTGRLRASFTPYHSKKDAGIFSELDYSEKHHEGIGIPQRRLLPLDAEVKDDVRAIIEGHIAKALKVK